MTGETSQRLDKWLWCARFFKTRGQSSEAINGGKVHLGNQRVKPARQVKVGDKVTVRNGVVEWDITVDAIAKRRGPAPEAQALYTESEASVERRAAERETRRLTPVLAPTSPGRPTKRDRRRLNDLRGALARPTDE